jgi:DNA-binding MarR family transcriptional regulator
VNSEFDHDIQEFWRLLFTIVLDSEKRLANYLATRGLTPPQFYVLKTLIERDGRCLIGEIARTHHLTNATMTGLVKRLEAMQPPLVMREPSAQDRRAVYVMLTTEGQARFLAVQSDLLEQMRVILSLLTGDERQDLIRYFSRYLMMVTEQFPVNVSQLSAESR